MRKLLLSIVAIASIGVISQSVYGQEKPFRVGLKFGSPQIAGLNLEYVTPLLGKKLSADVDLSYFSFDVRDIKVGYTYFGAGSNYYFFKEGRGLYGGLGYGLMLFSLSNGVSIATANLSLLNMKIGGKHGGLFYFRWDLGYGVALGDLVLKFEGEEYKAPAKGGFIGDIGFGFAF